MNNNWVQSGTEYRVRSISQNVDKLPPANYTIAVDPTTLELYLQRLDDKFQFPYKLYGIETKFVNRVLKTYSNTRGNLGVLLNGVKGTGKSVTCEQIANGLNLPVIIINKDHEKLIEFLNKIQQDVLFFFDEYEKIFSQDGGYYNRTTKMLTIMDGALNNSFRKVFLLTTNSLNVDDNLLQRPGRIRYLKTFGNLGIDTIMEIVDDKLKITEHRDALIKLLSQLELITVDIVSSIIAEVNIHEEAPEEFFPVFNVKKMDNRMDVFKMVKDEKGGGMKEILFKMNAKVNPPIITESSIDSDLYINNQDLGEICEVKDGGVVVVKKWNDEDDKNEFFTYRFESVPTYQTMFSKFA